MLNKQRKLFCQEYIIDLNATAAAIRAGYSKKTARQIGSKLLTLVDIQEEIQQRMDERSTRTEIDSDDILKSILRTRDICEKYLLIEGEYGTKIDNTALNGITKNNELLGKHKKLFTDKVEHSGTVKTTVNIIPASKRKK